ncbi:hypothetical protein SAMN05216188_102729 [Lentzea xinjiangensis]|uniref:Uncharacterized protein n=1 Tax=Lentzea xinjiangensis TaxID=402600 RepID=A0A1H9EZS1_9PSEU|nr:hypothetical protein [Lentzea xinjiangensis]SEQ31141.1 hypothetical protein SAMN05216188_102729 [Lentzea xinjiangensis]
MPSSDFGPDGTQAPPPPRLYPDPLAGLVTADALIAPQWTGEYSTSRVSVPTTPAPSDDVRQAIWEQMERERRQPRARQPRAAWQQSAPGGQVPVGQQQQPAGQTGGVAAFLGCLVVIGFFVLVLIAVLGAIFSG